MGKVNRSTVSPILLLKPRVGSQQTFLWEHQEMMVLGFVLSDLFFDAT
jgi:hypothetical protein